MKNKAEVVRLTNILVGLPDEKKLISLFVLLNLTFSMIILSISKKLFLLYFFVIVLPNVLTLLVKDEKMTFKRNLFLNIVSYILLSVMFLITMTNITLLYSCIILTYSFLISIRFIIIFFSLNIKRNKLFFYSIFYSILGIILFIFYLFFIKDPNFVIWILKSFLCMTIFAIASLMIIYIINLPIHNAFGINAQEAVRGFIEHWYDNGYSLEEVLTKMSKKAKIPVHVYAFKKDNKIKSIFIIPYFHIGPFGMIGGGGIIHYLSKKLKEKYNCPIFIFHGTVTHDFNPVNSKNKEEILNKIIKIIENGKYKKLKSNVYYTNEDDIYFLGIDLSDNLLFSVSYSPRPTDDVDLGIGLSVMNLLKKYFKNSTYVDPHNCFEFGDNELDPGDERYYNLINYLKNFKKKNKKSGNFGFSQIVNDELLKLGYIGNNGVCVFVGEIENKKFCYVLIDGNNMEKGLREKYINLIRDLGFDYVEILTSDDHSINNVRGVMNPVRDSIVLRNAIREGIKTALENREKSLEVVFDEFLVDLDVFGPKRENEIVAVVETTVKLLKVFGTMTFLSAFALSIAVLLLF